MVLAVFFVLLAGAATPPRRRRRRVFDHVARRAARAGGQRRRSGVTFTPKKVDPNRRFTLTFYTEWRTPFNITIGSSPPLEGYIDETGLPQVEVPGLPPGRQRITVWFGVGDSKRVGIITVLKPIRPAIKWGAFVAVVAFAAIVGGVAYKQAKKWHRRKRQKRRDGIDLLPFRD
jgi:hypothetical protein